MEQENLQQPKKSFFRRFWWVGLISIVAVLTIYIIIAYRLTIWPFERWGGPSKIPDLNSKIETIETSDINYETVYKTSFGFIHEKKGMLIKSQEELENLWPNITPMGGNNPLPQVDFSKERIAVVSLGNYSACNKLEISRVYRSGDKLVVQYTITNPDGPCPCTMDIKLFLEAVKFSATENNVEFEEKLTTEECWDKQ